MRIALASFLVLGACGGDDAAPLEPDAEPASTATQIFLNRAGGTYRMGTTENSRTNTSTVLTAELEFGTYDTTDVRWDAIVTCMEDLLAPFNVEIVDEDPGTAPHEEVLMVAAADWLQVTDQDNVGGISPFSCSRIDNAITLVNPEVYGDDDFGICWVATQGVGAAAGLDHTFSCPDVMTYLDTCGPDKSFTDEDVACGEDVARDCCTGDATQNSYQRMINVFGAAP